MSDTKAPVEGKVWSGTIGAGAGIVVSKLLLWFLGVLVFGASYTAEAAALAVAAVPEPIADGVTTAVAVGGAFIGGYLAKHTPRADVAETVVSTDSATSFSIDTQNPVADYANIHERVGEESFEEQHARS